MARLVDVPKVLRTVGPFAFVRRVWTQMNEDRLFTWASALAYSWLFAAFPFVITLISVIPYLPDAAKGSVRTELNYAIYGSMPKEAADTIWKNVDIDELLNQPRGWLIYLGLAMSIWAASSGMAATMAALDRCYELKEDRSYLKQRVVALGLTLVVSLLIVVVMALLPVGTALKGWVIKRGFIEKGSPLLVTFDVTRWALALLLLITILALIYYWGVNVRHKFNWLTPGALFCLATWLVLGLLFRFYVEKFGTYNKTYGTVAGVAILLLMFYLDAAVLMVGAEINSEIDFAALGVPRGTRNLLPAEEAADKETRRALWRGFEVILRPFRRTPSSLSPVPRGEGRGEGRSDEK